MSVQMKLTDARAALSKLCKGTEVVEITVDGKVVATLTPLGAAHTVHAPARQEPAPNMLQAARPLQEERAHAPYDTPAVDAILRKAFPRKR